jgi:CRP/FNR family transcriptional regulator
MKIDTSFEEASKIISAVSYFVGLDSRTLERIVQSASPHNYDSDQLVILEGEPASGLFIIQYGWLKVSKIAMGGREQILQFLGAGEVFNAVSVFTDAPNPATVTALEETRLWVIRRQTLLQLLDTNPRMARSIIQDLAGRITHLISLVEDLSLRTIEARLARLLLEQSVGEVVQRQKWATQTEIASRLGTVPDLVSRTMRKLVERGLIQISRNEIIILNRAELEKIALIEEAV